MKAHTNLANDLNWQLSDNQLPMFVDDPTALNNGIKPHQWNMTLMVAWKRFLLYLEMLFSMFSLRLSHSATTSMGYTDVPDLVLC